MGAYPYALRAVVPRSAYGMPFSSSSRRVCSVAPRMEASAPKESVRFLEAGKEACLMFAAEPGPIFPGADAGLFSSHDPSVADGPRWSAGEDDDVLRRSGNCV